MGVATPPSNEKRKENKKVKIILTDEEFNNALSKAIQHLYTRKLNDICEPWFSTQEEAEEWGGDIIYDVVSDTLEALGFEVE